MSVLQELRNQVIAQMQGAMTLNLAFIGISNNLFSVLDRMGKATPEELASKTELEGLSFCKWERSGNCWKESWIIIPIPSWIFVPRFVF